MKIKNEMIDKRNWNEFRDSGLGLIVNQILHIFGWAIVFELDGENVMRVFPARVKFRGFDKKSTSDAYVKVTSYLKENINELDQEVNL